MKKDNIKYSSITYKIIGCAMNIHKTIGNGFQELIYQRALIIEMNKQNIAFEREYEMPVFYEDVEVGRRRVDFLVEEKVVVEIKAITQLEKVHLAQAINYLEAFDLEIGLLINFGAENLQFHRLINNKKGLQ